MKQLPIVKNVTYEVTKEYQCIEMEFCDAAQRQCGYGKLRKMVRSCHAQAKIDGCEVEVRMAPADQTMLMLKRHYMPQSSGSILLNGKTIGKYTSTREVMVMNSQRTRIRILPDHPIRRFYWARQHGLSPMQALAYSSRRNMFLLVEGETALSSFCGQVSAAALLSEHDAREVEGLEEHTRYCIFALCLLWNACCPQGSAADGTPLRGHVGDAIPDIPSYTWVERGGVKMLSLEPEDMERRLTLYDRLLCLFFHRFYIFCILLVPCCLWLLLTLVAQQADQADWRELILPCSALCLLVVVYSLWVRATGRKEAFRFAAR